MKKTILLLALGTIGITAKAQLGIFTGGKITIGATSAPLGSYHQVIGGIAFPSTTSSITSAAYIRGNNAYSSATTPDYTWLGNDQTGLFHPSSNVLGVTINGSEKFRFNTYGQLLNSNSTSSASTPDYSWNSDANTGIYRPANDVIGFSTNGAERMRINSSGNVQINTTSLNYATLNISSSSRAISLEVNHTSNYVATMVTKTNKELSSNYVVNYGDTDRFYVAGAGWIYSQGSYLGSDINIKDDIFTLDSATAKINAIRGVRYKLKQEKQHLGLYGGVAKEYMGVIAQEVEAVAPQVVRTLKDGTKAVCYEMLVGLLIEGMKEQNQKIDQLESDLNRCCSKTKSLRETTNETGINNATSIENDAQSYIKQNRPNPFNNQTVIDYYVKETNVKAVLMIFDMNGKILKNHALTNGTIGEVKISSNELGAGMFYYSLVIDGVEIDTKKMIITK